MLRREAMFDSICAHVKALTSNEKSPLKEAVYLALTYGPRTFFWGHKNMAFWRVVNLQRLNAALLNHHFPVYMRIVIHFDMFCLDIEFVASDFILICECFAVWWTLWFWLCSSPLKCLLLA